MTGKDYLAGSRSRVRVERQRDRRTRGQSDQLGGEEARTEAGAIPANVSENMRLIVTAGLANDVELVNQ